MALPNKERLTLAKSIYEAKIEETSQKLQELSLKTQFKVGLLEEFERRNPDYKDLPKYKTLWKDVLSCSLEEVSCEESLILLKDALESIKHRLQKELESEELWGI